MQARIVDPMGFAVNPAIVNRPVALEVDTARHGQMRRLALAVLVLVAAACFSGWQRQQTVNHGFDIGTLRSARASEEVLSRRLRMQLATDTSPGEIAAKLQKHHLELVAPSMSDVIVLHRVERPEQPPSSVVASR